MSLTLKESLLKEGKKIYFLKQTYILIRTTSKTTVREYKGLTSYEQTSNPYDECERIDTK